MNFSLDDIVNIISEVAISSSFISFILTFRKHIKLFGIVEKIIIASISVATDIFLENENISTIEALKIVKSALRNNEIKYLNLFFPNSNHERDASTSLVGLLAIKRSKKNILASSILLSALITYEFISYNLNYSLINLPVVLLALLIVAISVDEYILSYRVRNGYFGTNKEEAREIINFILDNAKSNNNFNGPDGKIRLFDEAISKNIQSSEDYGIGFNPALN